MFTDILFFCFAIFGVTLECRAAQLVSSSLLRRKKQNKKHDFKDAENVVGLVLCGDGSPSLRDFNFDF